MLWIFRQKLVGTKLTIRSLRHDIGKGATAINPKLPLSDIVLRLISCFGHNEGLVPASSEKE